MTAAREIAHLFRRRVAQDAQAEPARHLETLGAALRIGRGLEHAGDARVHDDDRERRGERKVFDVERAAIEKQRVTGAAVDRRHLVLDPAGHSSCDVFRLLGRERKLVGIERLAREVGERERARDFERRARRQPRADRHVRRDIEGRTSHSTTAFGEYARDARNRSTPGRLHRRWFVAPVDGNVDRAFEFV